VIGNSSIEMLVFSDREMITGTTETVVTERYEALRLGVALTTEAILNVPRIGLLNGTLREFLLAQGLL